MLLVNLKGRLGNHMFFYAACRSIAEKNNFNYYINGHGDSVESIWVVFPHLERGIIDGEIKFSSKNSDFIIKNSENILNCNDYTILNGYLQNEIWFDYNEINIKKWFNISCDSAQFEKYDDYCFIHFRGQDYKHLEYFLPLDYYNYAILEMKKKYNIKNFVIITDDIYAAKIYFPNYEILNNDEIIDLYLLTKCKYLILSNSTFCWWGGWLNDNAIEIIAPFGWFTYPILEENTNISKKFRYIKHI